MLKDSCTYSKHNQESDDYSDIIKIKKKKKKDMIDFRTNHKFPFGYLSISVAKLKKQLTKSKPN